MYVYRFFFLVSHVIKEVMLVHLIRQNRESNEKEVLSFLWFFFFLWSLFASASRVSSLISKEEPLERLLLSQLKPEKYSTHPIKWGTNKGNDDTDTENDESEQITTE